MNEARIPFLDLAAINGRFEADFSAALARVATSGHWVLGSEVQAFESEFAAYCGSTHTIGVGNGLDALELVLRAWGIGPGDEVIAPSNTFIATWLAATLVGATIVQIDADPQTHTIDAARIAAALSPRTRVVIPVHLYGRPAPMDEIMALAHARGFKVLEDAAQAHGARWRGKRAGAIGDAAAFSFYPGKNLGALGDAGAICTDDAALAQRLRLLRNYGAAQRYEHQCIGRNSRLDELQAAFLRAKLPLLDADNARRADIAARYTRALLGARGLHLPAAAPPHCEPVWHLYVVRHPRRAALASRLAEQGIETLVHYPRPPGTQLAYADTALGAATSRAAIDSATELLSLPIGPTMGEADVARVIEATLAACAAIHVR